MKIFWLQKALKVLYQTFKFYVSHFFSYKKTVTKSKPRKIRDKMNEKNLSVFKLNKKNKNKIQAIFISTHSKHEIWLLFTCLMNIRQEIQ